MCGNVTVHQGQPLLDDSHVVPFLASSSVLLRRTGVKVAVHPLQQAVAADGADVVGGADAGGVDADVDAGADADVVDVADGAGVVGVDGVGADVAAAAVVDAAAAAGAADEAHPGHWHRGVWQR